MRILPALPVVRALPALALLLMTAPAHAAGEKIDCDKATSTVEMTYCAEKAFEAADKELNEVYKAALAKIAKTGNPAPYDAKPWEAALRGSQRAWVAFRDAECKELEPMEWSGGTATSMSVLGCLEHLTQERVKALKERFNEARVP